MFSFVLDIGYIGIIYHGSKHFLHCISRHGRDGVALRVGLSFWIAGI